MRRQNSEWKTAFISEASKDLKNTDYFGFVELDQFACYVIADGMDDKVDAIAAKLAIDTIISKFTEAPSMRKGAMKVCLRAANEAMLHAKSRMRLKVSVTMVVTDYTKFRYGQAGNTRLRLYRGGHVKEKSKDHSLSMAMVEEERIGVDALSKHEERSNLYAYLGKHAFHPYISKKIKLQAADSISLYTRGIWENLDEGEMGDALAESTDDPQATVDLVEDLVLSKQSHQLEKYTFVLIFVNKIYTDPNKKRKIKRIIMICIPIFVIAVTITILLVVRYKKRQETAAAMSAAYEDSLDYAQEDNYLKAKENGEKAKKYAEELKDEEMLSEIDSLLKLSESVIAADENLDAKKYKDALDAYQKAESRSRYADWLGQDYIQKRLERSSNYLSVYEMISLGDTLAENLQYKEAEQKYLEAKALSGKIYFDEGRNSSIAALEKLYQDQKAGIEEKDKEVQEKATEQAAGTTSMALGDAAFAEGKYEEAMVHYATALQKFESLEMDTEQNAAELKLSETESKKEKKAEQETSAEDFLLQGDQAGEQKDFESAKKYYLLAKDVYTSMKEEDKLGVVERKLELLESRATTASASASEQVKEKEEEQSSAEKCMQQGDQAFEAGNYKEAKVFYEDAFAIYDKQGLVEKRSKATAKIKAVEQKMLEVEKQVSEAEVYLKKAETYLEKKQYDAAEKYYLMAQYVYALLENQEKQDEIARKLDLLKFEREQQEKKDKEKEKEKQKEEEEKEKSKEPTELNTDETERG